MSFFDALKTWFSEKSPLIVTSRIVSFLAIGLGTAEVSLFSPPLYLSPRLPLIDDMIDRHRISHLLFPLEFAYWGMVGRRRSYSNCYLAA
ncbi:MAG: hypothetical protein K2Y18_09035 [Alphaproteobacteria bacterium]|nr:hypothetical protein [Alphaproteobacteria bacterium]